MLRHVSSYHPVWAPCLPHLSVLSLESLEESGGEGGCELCQRCCSGAPPVQFYLKKCLKYSLPSGSKFPVINMQLMASHPSELQSAVYRERRFLFSACCWH